MVLENIVCSKHRNSCGFRGVQNRIECYERKSKIISFSILRFVRYVWNEMMPDKKIKYFLNKSTVFHDP